ncbi:MAG: Mini-ribonuclease 3 [Lachnospirales bacterium]
MEFFKNQDVNPDELAPLILAYIGDCVYELLVRDYVISLGNRPMNHINSMSRALVNAGSQSDMYDIIKDSLNEKEISVYKRGRNAKSHTKAKNQTVLNYRRATGIEALFGYLYLKGEYERLSFLFDLGRKGLEKLKNEKN